MLPKRQFGPRQPPKDLGSLPYQLQESVISYLKELSLKNTWWLTTWFSSSASLDHLHTREGLSKLLSSACTSCWWKESQPVKTDSQHLKILPVSQTLLFSLLVQQQEAGLSGSNHADAASHTGGAPSTLELAPHFQDTSALCPGCAVHHEGTKLLQASAWQGLGSSWAPPGSRKASAHLLFTLNEFLPSSAPLPKAHSVGSCEQISNSLVKTVSPYNERCQTLPTKKSIRLNFQQLDKSAAQLYLLHLK